MDYKYIEQLLERYWACETTLEEEQILRTFFLQDILPEHLEAYRDIFVLQGEQKQPGLSADFDSRMLKRIGEEEELRGEAFRAHRITFRHRLRPLYQAAGLVALLLTIGTAAQHSMVEDEEHSQPEYAATQKPDSQGNAYTAIPNQQSASLQTGTAPADTLEQTR